MKNSLLEAATDSICKFATTILAYQNHNPSM